MLFRKLCYTPIKVQAACAVYLQTCERFFWRILPPQAQVCDWNVVCVWATAQRWVSLHIKTMRWKLYRPCVRAAVKKSTHARAAVLLAQSERRSLGAFPLLLWYPRHQREKELKVKNSLRLHSSCMSANWRRGTSFIILWVFLWHWICYFVVCRRSWRYSRKISALKVRSVLCFCAKTVSIWLQ